MIFIAVERIEQYRQKNGTDILKVILKPTKNFPVGRNHFYTEADAEDLVKRYAWYLENSGIKNPRRYVMSHRNGDANANRLLFHKELYKLYAGVDANLVIDHFNMIEFDDTDANLTQVNVRQNQYNTFCRGYTVTDNRHLSGNLYFIPTVSVSRKSKRPFGCKIYKEDEACKLQYELETVWLKEQLGSDTYSFNILAYRRGSEGILDLERTGQISAEEATYRHILKYADNAWYVLRYGLEQYFKDNRIPMPEYKLDSDGFMIHSIINKKLCPFSK